MELIGKLRNKAIHAGVLIPTSDQSTASLLLTKDIISKVLARTERR